VAARRGEVATFEVGERTCEASVFDAQTGRLSPRGFHVAGERGQDNLQPVEPIEKCAFRPGVAHIVSLAPIVTAHAYLPSIVMFWLSSPALCSVESTLAPVDCPGRSLVPGGSV
jgi:hypothetical protein